MMRAFRLLLVATLCFAQSAFASDESKQLYTKGLVHFHAERFQDALSFFDQAVAANPQDVQARYYRGMTRARLENAAAAIEDLEQVVAIDPTFQQASLQLGVALVEVGRYRDAIAPLQRAKTAPELSAAASFYLGLAHYRLDDLSKAREELRLAARDESLRTAAKYYEGICDYRDGNWRTATEQFRAVVSAAPDSQMAAEANEFLERMGAGQQRWFSLWGEAGFQYDSNVALRPDDDVVQGTQQSKDDGRAVFLFGGGVAPWRSENGQLLLSYELFDSQHFDLTEFNLQNHRGAAQVNYATDRVQLGLFGRYDYYFIDNDESFLQEIHTIPWVVIPEENVGHFEMFYRLRWRDFKKLAFHPQSGFNHAPGIAQVFYLGSPQQYFGVGYRFDRENTDGDSDLAKSFQYYGHEINTELGWQLPFEITSYFTYAYRNESYNSAGTDRNDDEHRILVAFNRPFARYFNAVIEYFGTINDSNEDPFEYDRHIVSVTLQARY